jgi:hypothetical protein
MTIPFSDDLFGISPEESPLKNQIVFGHYAKVPYSVPKWRTYPLPKTLLGTYSTFYYEEYGIEVNASDQDWFDVSSPLSMASKVLVQTDKGYQVEQPVTGSIWPCRVAKANEMASLFAFFNVVPTEVPNEFMVYNNTFVNEQLYSEIDLTSLYYPWANGRIPGVRFRFDFGSNGVVSALGMPENDVFFTLMDTNSLSAGFKVVLGTRNHWDTVNGVLELENTETNKLTMNVVCLTPTGNASGGKEWRSDIAYNFNTQTYLTY